MTGKSCLIGILAFFAIFANAAATITPKTPPTLEGCYFIGNREELYGFAEIVNGTADKSPNPAACARLGKNIVVNEGVLTSEGYLNEADTANFAIWTPIKNFRGTFDGQGFTISGLYFNDGTRSSVGLFGSVVSEAGGSAAIIKNVAVSHSYLKGAVSVGAIVGWVNAGSPVIISNALNNSRIEAASSVAGGLVGLATGYTRLEQCVNWGYVGGKKQIGGIVGLMTGNDVAIINAYSEGVVESTSETANVTFAGGIVGQAGGNVALKNVYNRGDVVGDNGKGGIAGSLSGSAVVLVNAYNAGQVISLEDGAENTGAIVGLFQGREENFKYANVYYEISDGYGDAYGVGLPKTRMQDGSLAYLLHNYRYDGLDATVWGQDVESSLYPDFSGEISGATGLDLGSVILHTGVDDETLNLTYAPGYAFYLPVLSYDGYAFQGWYANDEFSGEPLGAFLSTSSDQQEFWAKFSKVYTISYVTGSGVTHFGEEILSYVEGVGVTLPKQVTKDGFVFSGWYGNKNLTGERQTEIGSEASGDKTLYAKWLEKKAPAKGADGCYVITDASELYGFAAIVNGTDGFTMNNSACAYLDNDIVVNENVLKPDGSVNEKDSADFMRWTPMNDFSGTFDGKGHTISGLYYNVKSGMDLERTGVGLFGSVRDGTSEAPVVIQNVGVEASYFGGVFNVGALIGYAPSKTNSNYAYFMILNSYSTSTIRAYQYGGGLVGKFDSYVFGAFVNCYSVGVVEAADSEMAYREIGALIAGNPRDIAIVNTYYLGILWDEQRYGTPATRTQFENGTVAYALHNSEEGSIWGQDVGTDPLPNFSGVVKNYLSPSSSSVASSSSSSVIGSSSSNEIISSSSKDVTSSSSNVVSSSSSSEPKSSDSVSSSSSSKEASSSSKRGFIPVDFDVSCKGKNCKTALPAVMEPRGVHIAIIGRNLQLSGVELGRPYTLFDMQGRIILSGRAGAPGFTISVPRAGNYLLQVGYQATRISVK